MIHHPLFNRRNALLALGGGAIAAAAGCANPLDPPAPCPQDPSRNGGVDWYPDAGRPVAWGEEHLTPANGAPMPMSIYYPSARFLPPRPMLQRCAGKFPLVMFIHGMAPPGAANAGFHRAWWRIAVALARSGHVVVVPNHVAGPRTEGTVLQPAIDYVLNQWEGAPWVMKQPGSHAVVGHSFGALMALRYAVANPGLGAVAALGPNPTEDAQPAGLWRAIPCPTFVMFARDEQVPPENPGSLFDTSGQDRWLCSYAGLHFDYLESSFPVPERGPCGVIGRIAADLLALFMGANLFSVTRVPIDLSVPVVTRTPLQEELAVAWLTSFGLVRGSDDCSIDLKWNVGGQPGSRVIAP